MRDIKREMIEVLLKNNVDEQFLSNNVTLSECDINSLSFIKIIVELEDTFEVVFDDESLSIDKYENFDAFYQSLLNHME